MIVMFFILVIVTVIVFEYYSHCNYLPYRLYKINDNCIRKLGFECISKSKNKLNLISTYQYKSIQLKVIIQRYTPFNIIGTAEIYKGNKMICNYSQLPKSFKTSLYKKYIKVRYPKTLAKIIRYESKNDRTRFERFCKKEGLLIYSDK